jgi:magnesium transporter
MGIGMGALIAGLFGMNVSLKLCLLRRSALLTCLQLTSHMEGHPYAFMGMTVASSFIAFFVAWTGLRRSAFQMPLGRSSLIQPLPD